MVAILKSNGKTIFEDPGVMPNPTTEKLNEGIKRAREAKADLILAVGGGSVCDYAKAVSVSVTVMMMLGISTLFALKNQIVK